MSRLLLQKFRELVSDQSNGLKKLESSGKKLLGYFCTYTPVEVIHASGFIPIRITGGNVAVEKADALTPTFICPYMRTALERGLRGDYDCLSGVVQGYSCDAACGIFNIWKENIGGPVFHSLPLPYNDSEDSKSYFRSALNELTEKLNDHGGCYSEDRLAFSNRIYSEIRSMLASLYNLRGEGKIDLTAAELLTVVQAGYVTDPEVYRELLSELLGDAEVKVIVEKKGIPVLISGSLIEDERFLEMIEENGGFALAEDLCTGLRSFLPVQGEGEGPVEILMNRYINRFPCPARTRAEDRFQYLLDLVKRGAAEGVVFIFQKFCTPHLGDYPTLVDLFRQENIPTIMMEIGEAGELEGQFLNRLEGFMEMLRQ